MGFLQRMSTTVAPARMRASLDPMNDRYYDIPTGWTGALSHAGVRVNADLALTLSAVWRAVAGISGDISTLPCQILQYLANGGKDRARNHPLAYLLRWQPNAQQTAQQFFGMTVGHQLLRGNAYWEIVAGPRGFAEQLVPRHPDRVRKERLPNGRPRYRLTPSDGTGETRYLTADEMVHVPDLLTFDGWLGASRIAYGTQSVGGMLGAEQAAHKFWEVGMMSPVVATHKGGEMDEDELKRVHQSFSLFSGSKNNGGILLVEEDLTIAKLGVDPEQAQLLATRQFGTKEVARWFNYPGHKLEAESQTQAYAAREQANLEYVMGCIRPICIGLEQVIQKDLILDQETFFAEFLIESLFRGDMASQAAFFTAMIRNRVYNPNEVRLKLNANPYDGGEEYCPWNTASAADNGGANGSQQNDTKPKGKDTRNASAQVRASMLAYEAGQRIVRREIAAVTKLAQKHASDPDGWKAGLQAFYQDHAGFVAETLKVSLPAAREYAAEHGLALANQGVVAMESWEHVVATELAAWALDGERAA